MEKLSWDLRTRSLSSFYKNLKMETLRSAYKKHSKIILSPFIKIPEVAHLLTNNSRLSFEDLTNLMDSVIKKYCKRQFIKHFTLITQGFKFLLKMKGNLTIDDLKDQAEILCFFMAKSKFERKSELVDLLYNKSLSIASHFGSRQIKEVLKIWDFFKKLSNELGFEPKFHKAHTDQILGKFIELIEVRELLRYKKEFLYFARKAPESFVNILLKITKDKLRDLNIAHLLNSRDARLSEIIESLRERQKVFDDVDIPRWYYEKEIVPYELPRIEFNEGKGWDFSKDADVKILMHMHIIAMPENKNKNVYLGRLRGNEIVVVEMEDNEKSTDYRVFKKGYDHVPKLYMAVLTSHAKKNTLKLYLEKFVQINHIETQLIINSIHGLLHTLKRMNDSKDFLPIITYKSLGISDKGKILFVDFSNIIDEVFCNIQHNLVLVKIKSLKDKFLSLYSSFNLKDYGDEVNIETLQCNSLGVLLKRIALGYIRRVKLPRDLGQEFTSLIEALENRTSTFSDIFERLSLEDTQSVSLSQ